MLVSAILRFRALESFSLPGNGGEEAHGLLFSLLREAVPSVSERWHELKGPKPFSLSGVRGEGLRREGGRLHVPEGGEIWLRLSTLTDEGAEALALLSDLLLSGEAEPRLGEGRLEPLGVDLGGGSELALSSTYSSLLRRARPHKAVSMRFVSPTAFRRGGVNYPLPDPRAVFSSLLWRWNAFSPIKMPPEIAGDFERAALARFRLRTELLEFGGFREVGFLGEVRFDLSRLPPDERRLLHALSLFAFFSGVGRHTAMGMGEVAPPPELASPSGPGEGSR